jgi:hypothetical protein
MACCLVLLAPQAAAQQGQRYAFLIGGLGGSSEYTEKFKNYLFETDNALQRQFGLPADHIIVLAEQGIEGEAFVDGVSTAENIRASFEDLAGRTTPDDDVYIILYGHGSSDGEVAQFNIPRRDLSSSDYAELVGGLRARRVIFINTASASAPFIDAISGPDRIVITATRRGTQRNETSFPAFLVEALSSPSADLNKDGDLSIGEVFTYASQRTAQSYEESNHLATEHALLEDTGDGEGHRAEELADQGEGNLAGVTYLKRQSGAIAGGGPVDASAAQQFRQKDDLEREIADLKGQKGQLGEEEYYGQLEGLFVQLARLNDAIEAGQQ